MPVLLVWALAAEAALVVAVAAPTVAAGEAPLVAAAAAPMVVAVAVPDGLPLTAVTMALVHPLGAVEVLPSGLEP
jgi:hypothetical protein